MIERIPIEDRTSWLAMRGRDLTASDVAAVAGANPERSPLRAYAEKLGIVSVEENDIMRRGRWLEAATVDALREAHPTWEIRRANVYLRDPDIRLGATPDVVATDPDRDGLGIIQCKAVAWPIFQRDWTDGAPLKFQLQALTEGMLAEASWVEVAALAIDAYRGELHEFPVPRHEGAEQRIRDLAVAFWANVDAGLMPAADYTQDSDVVAAMNSQVRRSWVDLSKDNRLPELLAERTAAQTEIARLTKIVEAADMEIREKVGDAEEGHLPGWLIRLPEIERAEHVVRASKYRRLTITDKREHEGPF